MLILGLGRRQGRKPPAAGGCGGAGSGWPERGKGALEPVLSGGHADVDAAARAGMSGGGYSGPGACPGIGQGFVGQARLQAVGKGVLVPKRPQNAGAAQDAAVPVDLGPVQS